MCRPYGRSKPFPRVQCDIHVDGPASAAGKCLSSLVEATAEHCVLLALVTKDPTLRCKPSALAFPELDVLNAHRHKLREKKKKQQKMRTRTRTGLRKTTKTMKSHDEGTFVNACLFHFPSMFRLALLFPPHSQSS